MGGFDDHVAIMGDWMPPSPSPRAFFSSMTNDESVVRSFPDSSENKTGRYFEGQSDQDCLTQASSRADELKMSSRGGLMERRAAKAGFNAPRLNTECIRNGDISKEQEVRSPYLTIPPGLSPTTLLESPVFLTNSLAQPSPTTGKFLFGLSGNNFRNSTLMTNDRNNCNENTFEDATSFAFKPIPESGSVHNFNSKNEVHTSGFAPHTFPSFGVSNTTSRQNQITEPPKTAENSPSPDEPHEDDGDQRSGGGQSEDDGYNWRKYGQKQVKGSEYPRSYYKCTHPNCPVKKKVERSYEGHITEIIYKGAHIHPKPLPSRRSSSLGPSNGPPESEQMGTGPSGDLVCSTQEYGNGLNGSKYESGDVVEGSCTFSNDEEDRATHGSVSLGCDGEGDELESKRRRIETYASEISGATRAIREPRVVVQTTSEVDILDDGYRWRKYGQKVVKGNPNPRSYYKCTSPACNVRKHVERASHDLKSVITTYEGKHNHDVPAARNSNHVGSHALPAQQAPSAPSHMQRPEPSQTHSSRGRFNRHSLGSFGLPGRPQQLGLGPGFGGFGLNQQSLANLGMVGLGHDQGKLPMMQVNPYLGRQIRPVNEMGFVLPKPEPKLEPVMDSGLNSSDGSLVYQHQQLTSRLPLGPQM